VSYTKQGPFVNDTTPALNATRMNAIDQGIYDAHIGAESISVVAHGAQPDSGINASAAFASAISEAEDRVGTTDGMVPVFVPGGTYWIGSTITVPQGVVLYGPDYSVSALAVLSHQFNGNLINITGSSASLRNLYLDQGGAYTGAAINHTAGAISGFLQFDRIVITDAVTTRGWERDVVINGTGSSIGSRSIFFNNCQFFSGSTAGETVVLDKVVHVFFSNCEVIQVHPTTIGGIRIEDNFSEDVFFSNFSCDGSFYSEATQLAYHGRVRSGRTITFGTGSERNVLTGSVDEATVVNNGASTNIVGTHTAINTQSGTTYTLVRTDASHVVRCTSGSAVTLTVPLNATVAFPIGTSIEVRQAGAGQVTVSPTGGVTLNSESSMRKTAAQHRSVSLVKVGTDTWDLDGSLAA
jgi:hypothetical protein